MIDTGREMPYNGQVKIELKGQFTMPLSACFSIIITSAHFVIMMGEGVPRAEGR